MFSVRHNKIRNCIHKYASLAGLQATLEPPTRNILGGQYSTEECKLLCCPPKKRDEKEVKLLRHQIMDAKCRGGNNSREQVVTKRNMDKLSKIDGMGVDITIDIQVVDPIEGIEMWIDVTVVHPTASSSIGKEMKATPQAHQGTTVRDAITKKKKHYMALLEVATHQKRHGHRNRVPIILPAVMSTYGEVSAPLKRLYKCIGKAYKRKVAQDPRMVWRLQAVADEFMNRMKTEVAIACAWGTALVMRNAGRTNTWRPLAREEVT